MTAAVLCAVVVCAVLAAARGVGVLADYLSEWRTDRLAR